MLFENDLIRYFKTRDRILTREKRIQQQLRYCVKNMKDDEPPLTDEQLAAVNKLWNATGFAYKVNPQWHQMYTNKTGRFSEQYIPNEFHYYFVENQLINYDYLRAFVDKNYYSVLFHDIKQPRTVIKREFGHYYTADFTQIEEVKAIRALQENVREGIVIKPSNNSWGGRNISFIKKESITDAEAKELFRSYGNNFIVQGVLTQHPALAAIHKDSVNTIRIITLMLNGKLHILSACLRMGQGKSQVDNFSQGGVGCGIEPDGRLKKLGYDRFGNMVPCHPDGFEFQNCVIPNFAEVMNTVKKAASRVPQFGVASWDFAIDESGDPVFIEYNISQGGIDIHQYNNGPLYGDLTNEVLDYVVKNYCFEDTTLAYNYNVFHDHITIKNASKQLRFIRVKAKHHELPVTRIGYNAFEGGEIRCLWLPTTVAFIDYCAFYRCTKLRSVRLPKGLKIVGRSAFNGCTKLRRVKLPDSVTEIRKYAFRDIKKLDIHIPCSVTTIDSTAFYGSNVTIHGASGSAAERFAQQHRIRFIAKK